MPPTPDPNSAQKSFLLPPIYPITDKKLARKTTHLAIIKELARGGACLIQIRDKDTPLQELLLDLLRCVEFSARRGITLILNDRCDLVLSVKASGLHLGQRDLPPQTARQLLGAIKVIGFSTHNLTQVRRAQELPLDYIGFGPIFSTATKKDAAPAQGLHRLEQACAHSTLPVVAIGGIVLAQVAAVLNAGAASAAVISDLMRTDDIARRMESFLKAARATGSILNRKDNFRR